MNNNCNLTKNDIHPCFSDTGHKKYARIHLPVAPKCNIQCKYCNRQYDCINESRPGVTSEILLPEQAYEKYVLVKEKISYLTVVGFAGPGDALANFEEVQKTAELIRNYDKDVIFCLSTNGLMLPHYADNIVEMGVSHVTVTINAVNPEIGKHIYKYINYNGEKLTGKQAAEIIISKQLEGLKLMTDKGMVCKVNIVAIKGINEDHIEEVVKKVSKLGAFKTNIMQMIPAEGSDFADMAVIPDEDIKRLRDKCSVHLKQMYHCQRCRADAIGLLHEDRSAEFRS